MFVSIIIPARNEERFIAKCLDSVLNFDGINEIEHEIIIVNGMSTDNTRKIVLEYSKQNSRIKLIENPHKIQSTALNLGIKEAKGERILRLDAHSEYPSNYLALLIETANRTDADNTGGVVNTVPFDNSYSASIVQALTTHKFGVGNSGFRVGMEEGIADTVPYGFFKKSVFEKIGFFDERLIRAQDYEFNRRISASGGKIWLNPSINLKYYNQPNLYRFLKKQIIHEAPYNAYMWYLAPYTFAYRHAITGVFAFSIFAGIAISIIFPFFWYIFASVGGLYLFIAIASAVQQAIKFKKPFHIITLPLSFFMFHFLHGIGVLSGLISLLLRISPVQKKKEPWKNAGKKRAFRKNE